jgi:hypothetical protein
MQRKYQLESEPLSSHVVCFCVTVRALLFDSGEWEDSRIVFRTLHHSQQFAFGCTSLYTEDADKETVKYALSLYFFSSYQKSVNLHCLEMR